MDSELGRGFKDLQDVVADKTPSNDSAERVEKLNSRTPRLARNLGSPTPVRRAPAFAMTAFSQAAMHGRPTCGLALSPATVPPARMLGPAFQDSSAKRDARRAKPR